MDLKALRLSTPSTRSTPLVLSQLLYGLEGTEIVNSLLNIIIIIIMIIIIIIIIIIYIYIYIF